MKQPAIQNAASRLQLTFAEAPSFGAGTLPAEKEKSLVLFAHIFSLIVWLWKRRESPAIDAHGKEALNFGITVFLFTFPVSFLAAFLPAVVGLVISLLLAVTGLGVLALVIYGGLQAREGRLLRYPLNLRLIK